ncbi:MAG: ChaN family lipoprotein [Phycisphaerales bacterium]|nr:ChaN family lipoprotein [Phycisphaerales bacterium]
MKNAYTGLSLVLVALASIVTLPGCAGSSSGPHHEATPRSLPHPATLSLFASHTGDRAAWVSIVDDASRADVVIIGEQHGHRVGLHAASVLFDDIIARAPQAALSMEFFERDQQNALDDYLTGVTSEEQFRKAAGRTHGNYPEGHRAMVEAAKAAGVPVYGSNAPRRYVSLARMEGFERFDTLTPGQQAMISLPPSLTEGRYRDTFFELMGDMGGHGGGDEDDAALTAEEREAKEAENRAMVEGFYRSQNVWDATMAASIAEAAHAGRHPVVHVVGQFHSDFDGGLVQRVRSLLPGARIVTFSVQSVSSEELREEDEGRADYVLYAGEAGR